MQRLAPHIAARLAPYDVDVVCGPLAEGAFVALMVASALGVPFTYTERFVDRDSDAESRSRRWHRWPSELWAPGDCPLCARGVPFVDSL